MPNTTEQRLAALEAENAQLRADMASLKPAPRPVAPPEPEGASIRTELPGARFTMPTEAELRRLHAIVLVAYPMLHREPGRFDSADVPFQEFATAFRAIGAFGRVNEIHAGKGVTHWIERAEGLLRTMGKPAHMDSRAFVAAVLAHGDVPFRDLGRFPYETGFGLAEYAGKPAGEAWRTVLADGRPPQPSVGASALVPLTPRVMPSW